MANGLGFTSITVSEWKSFVNGEVWQRNQPASIESIFMFLKTRFFFQMIYLANYSFREDPLSVGSHKNELEV